MAKQKPQKNPDLEYPDQTPVHIPGVTDKPAPLSLREELQRYVRQEMSRQAQEQQLESFDEADDFEVDDEEPDLTTEYSVTEMSPPPGSISLDGEPTQEDTTYLENGAEPQAAEGSGKPPAPSPAEHPEGENSDQA